MSVDARPYLRPTRILQIVLGLGVAVAMLIWGLPYFAKTSWSEVFTIIGTIPRWKALSFAGLVVAGLGCYTFVMTGAMPGLNRRRALIVNLCGSSVSNLLPVGGAVGLAATYSICRSWGFSPAAVSTQAIVTGIWNTLARVCLPVVAILALMAGARDVPLRLRDLAIAGAFTGTAVIAVAVLVLVNETAARRVGRFLDQVLTKLRRPQDPSIEESLTDLRTRITEVVRTGWLSMTLGMVGFFGLYYVLFLLCLHTTGVELPRGQMFAAFAIGRLLTAVGVTPGGIGVTETATAAALVAWGAPSAEATAGVVLFSLYTHLLEIPLGALAWLAWSLMPKASKDEIIAADQLAG